MGYPVSVEESDLHELRRARAELDAAEAVARRKRAEFKARVSSAYATKSRGDLKPLAEAAGLSTAQVKRVAGGETSGNRRKASS
jgi:hypothetical protein